MLFRDKSVSIEIKRRLFAVSALGLLGLASCASYEVARDVKLLSFSGSAQGQEKSLGQIEGRSCQWSLLGWPIGAQPTVRTAIDNAVAQRDGAALPGAEAHGEGAKVAVLRDVATDSDYFNFIVAGRACVNARGLGAL